MLIFKRWRILTKKQHIAHIHTHEKQKKINSNIRTTQQSPIENSDSDGTNSEMLLTNEVNIHNEHTESLNMNKDYLKLISELTANTETSSSSSSAWSPSSEQNDATANNLIEIETARASSSSNRPNVVNVISV